MSGGLDQGRVGLPEVEEGRQLVSASEAGVAEGEEFSVAPAC